MQETTEQLNILKTDTSKILVFDIETQRGFHEIKTISDMGVAVAVSCECSTGEYKYFTEDNVEELIDDLFSADYVVGYNIINFDYAVLKGYTDKDFRTLKTIDLMQKVQRSLGYRPKLDHLVSATLGAAKSADGLQSLRWYKQGKIDLIKEYCHMDVKLTKELFEFGRANGYVLVKNKYSGEISEVKIKW